MKSPRAFWCSTNSKPPFGATDHTGTPDYDSLSAQQVDSNTAKFTFKKGGKVVGSSSRTVSKDGKTLTSNMKVTTAKGGETESVLVFDKQ